MPKRYKDDAVQQCYEWGVQDGSSGSDTHDVVVSYGSKKEMEAYIKGVRDGESKTK